MRAWAKKFKEVFDGLIQALWTQEASKKPIERSPQEAQKYVNIIQVLEA